jgi:hypothetical protein
VGGIVPAADDVIAGDGLLIEADLGAKALKLGGYETTYSVNAGFVGGGRLNFHEPPNEGDEVVVTLNEVLNR